MGGELGGQLVFLRLLRRLQAKAIKASRNDGGVNEAHPDIGEVDNLITKDPVAVIAALIEMDLLGYLGSITLLSLNTLDKDFIAGL